MNPFKLLVRFVVPFFQCWLRPAQEIPIERPPRGRVPRTRTHVVWTGAQMHPFPLTISDPEREEHWRR